MTRRFVREMKHKTLTDLLITKMSRSSSDCSWLDRRLQCNNRTILENNPTMLNGETATGESPFSYSS